MDLISESQLVGGDGGEVEMMGVQSCAGRINTGTWLTVGVGWEFEHKNLPLVEESNSFVRGAGVHAGGGGVQGADILPAQHLIGGGGGSDTICDQLVWSIN